MAAIRRYCLWCCCDSAAEVRLCPSTDCSLHPFRFGRRPRPADKAPVPQLTAAERQGRDQQQAAHQWRLHQAQQLIDLADGAEVEQ